MIKMLKDILKRSKKGFILDPIYLVIMFTIASIVFIFLALLWVDFVPQLNAINSQGQFPLNATTQAKIDGVGNFYFLTGGQGTLLFFFFVMVIAMFISAYAESSGFLALPVSLFFLIMMMITAMILSDTAHAILTSPGISFLVAQHFGTILYLEDNLPLLVGVLTIGYIVFVLVRRGDGGSRTSAGRVVSG